MKSTQTEKEKKIAVQKDAIDKHKKRVTTPSGPNTCTMCSKSLTSLRYLNLGKCLQKYGAVTAHRVCEPCWFGTFVGAEDHRCPGCVKGIPRPTAPPAPKQEYYDEIL